MDRRTSAVSQKSMWMRVQIEDDVESEERMKSMPTFGWKRTMEMASSCHMTPSDLAFPG